MIDMGSDGPKYSKLPHVMPDADDGAASDAGTVQSDAFDSEVFVEEFDRIFAERFDKAFRSVYKDSVNKAFKNACNSALARPKRSQVVTREFSLAYGIPFKVALGIRITQAVFGTIILGLAAGAVDRSYGSDANENFLLFTAVWSTIALMYYLLAWTFQRIANRSVVLALESITTLWWFVAFITSLAIQNDELVLVAGIFGSFQWFLFSVTCFTTARYVHMMRKRDSYERVGPFLLDEDA